jgi:hypothetical protein
MHNLLHLDAKVLQSLVVHPVHANNLGTTVTSGGWNTPVCASLKRFGLRYRRWLRPSEQFDLIPDFVSIIWSRQQSKFSLQSFRIWTRSDQKDPLELLEGSRISRKGFERLANDCAIKGGDLLQLMGSGIEENMGVGQAEVREFLRASGFTPPPPLKELPPPPSCPPSLGPPRTAPPSPSSPHKETAESPRSQRRGQSGENWELHTSRLAQSLSPRSLPSVHWQTRRNTRRRGRRRAW